jgi:hypothetical protein
MFSFCCPTLLHHFQPSLCQHRLCKSFLKNQQPMRGKTRSNLRRRPCLIYQLSHSPQNKLIFSLTSPTAPYFPLAHFAIMDLRLALTPKPSVSCATIPSFSRALALPPLASGNFAYNQAPCLTLRHLSINSTTNRLPTTFLSSLSNKTL